MYSRSAYQTRSSCMRLSLTFFSPSSLRRIGTRKSSLADVIARDHLEAYIEYFRKHVYSPIVSPFVPRHGETYQEAKVSISIVGPLYPFLDRIPHPHSRLTPRAPLHPRPPLQQNRQRDAVRSQM